VIPFMKPFVSPQAISAVQKVLESGWLGEGSEAALFEKDIGTYIGSEHVNAVNSCTSALELTVDLLGLVPGDVVISTPMTCAATNIPFVRRGITIRWADICPETGNIEPKSIEDSLDLTVKAIIIVDWGGEACDHARVRALSEASGVPVVEDAAHAFGSTYHGKKVGTHHDFVCFSFQAIKTITSGDGGALLCASSAHHSRARRLRWFGIDREARKHSSSWDANIEEAGYKFHMNDVAASLARANFSHIDWLLSRASANAAQYDAFFEHFPHAQVLHRSSEATSSNWLYTILCQDRERLSDYLLANGVGCATPHTRNDAYRVFRKCHTPRPLIGVDRFSREYLNLPVGYWVTAADIERVCDLVRVFYS
jgi:perosamine synthetase